VLKDKHGDITSTDMYRPITVTPVISKLFELVMLQLYGDFLTSDNLQFGFNEETGCGHALLPLPNLLSTLLIMAVKSTAHFWTPVRRLMKSFLMVCT